MKKCLVCDMPIPPGKNEKTKVYCSLPCYWKSLELRAARRAEKSFRKIFFSRVEKVASGCWEWTGADCGHGYGKIGGVPYLWDRGRYGRVDYAHRVSYWLHNGRLPDGLTRHTCDNRKCVNPDHLVEGSHHDNLMDAVERGRMPIKKLLSEDEIKAVVASDLSSRKLSEMYGVSSSTVLRYKRLAKG